MAFDKPYDIDPSPTGDTVKEAVVNTDLNVDDIYANLNLLLNQIDLLPETPQEILAELLTVDGTGSELDADKVDGFHAADFSHISHSHPEVTSSVPGFMSPLDKQKLNGVASGAEVNVQSDWAETGASEDAFIRNKPKILKIDGAPESGDVAVFTAADTIHGSNDQEMQTLLGYFTSSEFISQTAGSADAGKPILTGADGLIHASLIPAVPAQAVWGGITGTLSNQTDLQDELDLKLGTGAKAADSELLDGLDSAAFELALGNPTTDGYILSSLADGTRSWIVPPSGGGGDAVWGSITGTLSDQDDLQAALDAKSDDGHTHDDRYFQETEFLSTSAGAGDAGKPIVLNGEGKVDPSMMAIETFHYVGDWTPTAGTEYPDISGETPGAFWIISNLGSGVGYTFVGGDLTGEEVFDGNYIVWGSDGWSIIKSEMNPAEYYKLDGSQAITAPFSGGGQQLKNIAEGTENTDAVTFSQLSGKANVDHDHVEADITDLDKYTRSEVDSRVGAKENSLGNPTNDGEILSSLADGTRSWIPLPGASVIEWGDIEGTLSNQTDLQDALDLKLDITAKASDSELLDGLEAAAFELALGVPDSDNEILVSLTDGTRGWAPLPVTQWGGIEGTLASQTDLQTALDGKSPTSHDHDSDYLSSDGGTVQDYIVLTGAGPTLSINANDSNAISSYKHSGVNRWQINSLASGLFTMAQMNQTTGAWVGNFMEVSASETPIPTLEGESDGWKIAGSQIYTDDYHPAINALLTEIDQLKQRITALGG